jgi:3-oxoacyl-[acyl-carrier protein] reductase
MVSTAVVQPALFDFRGTTALVTGGSRGIGRAIALAMLAGGGSVVVTSTHEAPPEWIRDWPAATHVRLDMLDERSIAIFLERIDTNAARIDILVNNAGVHELTPIDDFSAAVWERIHRVNVLGPTRLISHFALPMKAHGYGRVVNIASIAGDVCKPDASAYASSKLALIGLSRSVAADLAPHGILVNAVSPGTTRTEMVDRSLSPERQRTLIGRIPLGRFAEVEEVAVVAAFLASRLNTYITGQNIVVDGGTSIV